jgi:hypothetical protein
VEGEQRRRQLFDYPLVKFVLTEARSQQSYDRYIDNCNTGVLEGLKFFLQKIRQLQHLRCQGHKFVSSKDREEDKYIFRTNILFGQTYFSDKHTFRTNILFGQTCFSDKHTFRTNILFGQTYFSDKHTFHIDILFGHTSVSNKNIFFLSVRQKSKTKNWLQIGDLKIFLLLVVPKRLPNISSLIVAYKHWPMQKLRYFIQTKKSFSPHFREIKKHIWNRNKRKKEFFTGQEINLPKIGHLSNLKPTVGEWWSLTDKNVKLIGQYLKHKYLIEW